MIASTYVRDFGPGDENGTRNGHLSQLDVITQFGINRNLLLSQSK